MPTDFTLPELGENIAAGDVLRVLVKPGDTVAKDQTVLELETDKATVEVPSSVAGQVKNVNVKAGDKVKVGQVILTVEGGAAAAPATPAPEPKAAPAAAPTGPSEAVSEEPGFEQHVGSIRRGSAEQPGEAEPAQAAAEYRPRSAAPAPRADGSKIVDIRGARGAAEAAPSGPAAPAAPSVRRMARELGLDINDVPGTGADGRISVDDVKAHAKRVISGGARASSGGAPAAAQPLPDFSRWGAVERQPMRAVRRKTAEHLAAAWATIPHVTQHDLADITELEALRKKYAKQAEAAGGALTITAIALKVIAAALRKFPQFNSSLDLAADELVFKKYVHIGVAVDTDRGLLVPVIRDVDTKGIFEIAKELTELSEKARTRKIAAEEMQGGCFSVSNLGGLGGTSFTPIVNAPEVAVLGISRARMEPVWQRDADSFAPRLMLPLSLSYDHRVIDGADGVRFLRWVIDALEQPFVLALNG